MDIYTEMHDWMNKKRKERFFGYNNLSTANLPIAPLPHVPYKLRIPNRS